MNGAVKHDESYELISVYIKFNTSPPKISIIEPIINKQIMFKNVTIITKRFI